MQIEVNLKKWGNALEKLGMGVSRRKTEYLGIDHKENEGTILVQNNEVKGG